MKRRILLFGAIVITMLFVFQSCKKDDFSDLESTERYQKPGMESYDEFGPKLEQVVDRALEETAFKNALIKLTQERRMGDFEILMTSLLGFKTEGSNTIKDLMLDKATGVFNEEELDRFLESYPSLIIATRGNIESWARDEYFPPTVFVPSSFKETNKSILGTKKGQKTNISLEHHFEDAVIAMHISERHDERGNPIIIDHTPPKKVNTKPSINLSDEGNVGLRSSTVEPTFCPDAPPVITEFTAENSNGGVQLSYVIENFPESLGSWGRIYVRRIGPPQPNGEPEIHEFWPRGAHQINTFYDVGVNPNIEYTYEIYARVQFYDPLLQEYDPTAWILCENSNTMEATITAAPPLPLLNSFRGKNHDNTTLKYNWYPPQDGQVTEYRLRRLTDNGYTTVDQIPAGSGNNFFFYDHPVSDRGKLVEMQIQYREAAGWGGDYFDRSYASYRNPYEPLKYYGSRLTNSGLYELSTVGESLLHGAPEIRLLAVRGAGTVDDRNTVIVQQTVIFMQACTRHVQIGPLGISLSTAYFIPIGGDPVEILEEWDNNLEGSAITVKLSETDIADIVINDQTNTETITIGINAEFGFKAGVDIQGIVDVGVDFSVGLQASYKAAKQIDILYPTSDIDMDFYTIYYHNQRELIHNNHLYGNVLNDHNFDCGDIVNKLRP